jgi:hypothetical protein
MSLDHRKVIPVKLKVHVLKDDIAAVLPCSTSNFDREDGSSNAQSQLWSSRAG